jgi:hypothetical protein
LVRPSQIESVYRSAVVRPSDLWAVLRLFGLKGWTAAAIGSIVAFLALGVATAMMGNPFFIRMIPA